MRGSARVASVEGATLPPLRIATVGPVGTTILSSSAATVIAPLGIDDLLGLRCRPTDFGRTQRDEYEARIASKRWRELWPKVRFLD